MSKNHIIGVVVAVLVVGGVAFYAGTAFGKGQAPAGQRTFSANFGGAGAAGGFAGRGGRGGANGGFTAGKIISAGNGSISIQMQNGSSSEIVLLGTNTQIMKSVAGSASDLTVGQNVTIQGTPNSDGSLSATSIQIIPAGANMRFGQGGTQTQTAPAQTQ